MMKVFSKIKLLKTSRPLQAVISAIMILVVFPFHFAQAANPIAQFFDIGFGAVLNIAAYVIYIILTAASFFLTLCASLLNVAMYYTTHLQMFIDEIPAIYQLWQIIRDLSLIVFIFMILWAAFRIIFDIKGPKYKELLLNIVIVGIFINFSFFITTVAIDASNLVSLQLYNAINPQISTGNCPEGMNSKMACVMGSGLATVIVQSMDINEWWGNKSAFRDSSEIGLAIRRIVVNSAAIGVTVLAALSFLGAAVAALWRVCVLVFLLALSPLWVVGWVLPQVKSEVSGKWWNHLRANLIFLPVYLLLMYVALRIIQGLNLGNLGETAGPQWYAPYAHLFIGFVIVFFLINLPLATALSFAGAAGTALERYSKGFSGSVGSWIGRSTLGRTSYAINKSDAMRKLTSRVPGAGAFVSGQLTKLTKNEFGAKGGSYEGTLASRKKSYDATHKYIGTVNRADFAAGEAGDKAFKDATDRAKEYKKDYLANLPWKASVKNLGLGGVIGFMVDNRASKQFVTKNEEDARKKDNKKKLADNKNKAKDLKQQIQDIEKEINKKEAGVVGFARPEKATKEESDKVNSLKEELKQIQEKIDEGEEQTESDRVEKTANAVAEKTKKES